MWDNALTAIRAVRSAQANKNRIDHAALWVGSLAHYAPLPVIVRGSDKPPSDRVQSSNAPTALCGNEMLLAGVVYLQ